MKNLLQKKIEKEVDGKLRKINHQSYNAHFVGYSQWYGTDVFIKAFPRENSKKFNTELNIIRDDSNRYIDNLEIDDFMILILKDYNLEDLNSVSEVELKNIALIISDFHYSNEDKELPKSTNFSNKLCKTLDKLKRRDNFTELKGVFDKFQEFFELIDLEYNQFEKVSIHGDFGIRNIKKHNGKDILIDFERSKKDIYFLDFIKFFYIDLEGKNYKKEIFLKEYHNNAKYSKKISKLLEYALIFYTGLGIMKYTMDFEDKEFEKVGLKMIEDCRNFLKNVDLQ